MYKSVDGGDSWEHIGLEDSWHIGEISINPYNPNIVFVSVLGHFWSKNINRGVYRTLDGGKTWDHVLAIDEKTGSNDIVISQSNPNIIYTTKSCTYIIIEPNSIPVQKTYRYFANATCELKALVLGIKPNLFKSLLIV